MWDDVLYTIPLGAGPVGTTFRRDVAEEAGITMPERFSPEFTNRLHARGGDKGPQSRIRHDGLCADAWPLVLGHHLPALSLCLPDAGRRVGDEYVDENWNITINNERTIDSIDYFVSFREFMPADSANWGIDEATSMYQSGRAFGLWNYQDFIKGFFEDEDAHPEIAGRKRSSAHPGRPPWV